MALLGSPTQGCRSNNDKGTVGLPLRNICSKHLHLQNTARGFSSLKKQSIPWLVTFIGFLQLQQFLHWRQITEKKGFLHAVKSTSVQRSLPREWTCPIVSVMHKGCFPFSLTHKVTFSLYPIPSAPINPFAGATMLPEKTAEFLTLLYFTIKLSWLWLKSLKKCIFGKCKPSLSSPVV